jgi:tripartite-type tricarboxylate transporter receptor subunit TctC
MVTAVRAPIRPLVASLVAAALVALINSAIAQHYPTRPIRVIVPFPAGSGVDLIARPVAQALTDAWKHTVVIDNRAGAGGTIGGELAARAPADGYTLFLGNVSTLAIAPGLYPKLPYDPLRDFAPITLLTTSENVIVLHPTVPATSVKELIAYARGNPRKLNYGSSGSGTTTHLAAAMFETMTSVQFTHVPYKGSAPMLTDLLAGQVQLAFSSVPTALPHIKNNRLRALAVTLLKRSSVLPELPTVEEAAGLKGFEVSLWQGMVAPAATPRAILLKLNEQITASLRTPDMRGKLTVQGLEAVGNTPEQFGTYIRTEIAKWTKVIKASGARVD